MPASENSAFDIHSTDPSHLKSEIKQDLHLEYSKLTHMASGDFIQDYKGHRIEAKVDDPIGYFIQIDSKKFPGNFSGVSTAVGRAKHIIDQERV